MAQHSIWIDGEWYMHGRIFLLGYAYNLKKFGQLYGRRLTKAAFKKLLKPVNGFVYVYGPDIGVTEKFFGWKYRNKYRCVNLMKVFRDHITSGSFKLKHLEDKYGITRRVSKYKETILFIWRDWRNPHKRHRVLTYNMEDVINLMKLTKIIFKKHRITSAYLDSVKLS